MLPISNVFAARAGMGGPPMGGPPTSGVMPFRPGMGGFGGPRPIGGPPTSGPIAFGGGMQPFGGPARPIGPVYGGGMQPIGMPGQFNPGIRPMMPPAGPVMRPGMGMNMPQPMNAFRSRMVY